LASAKNENLAEVTVRKRFTLVNASQPEDGSSPIAFAEPDKSLQLNATQPGVKTSLRESAEFV
jgi:hypothetical protein